MPADAASLVFAVTVYRAPVRECGFIGVVIKQKFFGDDDLVGRRNVDGFTSERYYLIISISPGLELRRR